MGRSKDQLTRRGNRRREQIIETSLRLFAETGYHGTTVGDVCDALGVGKGVFYWYFSSKEDLFTELIQDTLYSLRRAQQAAIQHISDPVLRIEVGIKATIGFFRADPGRLELIRTASRYEEFAPLVERGQEIVVSDVAAHIKEGMSAGAIRHGDPELMAHGVLGAIFHFVETYFGTYPETADVRPELADEAAAFCLKGLLNRPA